MQGALSQIKDTLQKDPRGLNVTEIAKEIKMNRLTVAKYLEMLVVSGQVDVRKLGPSKVYYISHRLPISAMLSLSSDFIIILDKNLKIINVNDMFLEFAKINREDLLYKCIENFSFPLEFDPSIMPNIKDALKGKESIVEAYFKKNDMERYYDVKFIPMVLDDGEKGVTIFFENITGRKKAEEVLRESEERFHATFEQAAVGIAHVRVDGRFLRLNQRYCDIVGYTQEELTNRTFESITYPDDIEASKKYFDALKAGRINSYSLEKRYVRKDGSNVWVNVTVSALHKPNGSLKYIIPVIQDITDRKRAEDALHKAHDELDARVKERTLELEIANRALMSEIEHRIQSEDALRASEQMFRNLVENVEDGAWGLDENIAFTYMSPRMYEMLGYSPEEIIGKTPYDLMPADIREEVRQKVPVMVAGGSSFKLFECELLHKDGRRVFVKISGSPIFDAKGVLKGYRGITRDVTKRNRKT